VTFLVNVWLNYRPAGVCSAPADVVSSIISSSSSSSSSVASGGGGANQSAIALPTDEMLSSVVQFRTATQTAVRSFQISRKTSEREELGEWEEIPFVSDKSEWGKSEDETGLVLYIWLPASVDALQQHLEQNPGGGREKGKGLKKSKAAGAGAGAGASSTKKSAVSTFSGSQLADTFEFHYPDDETAPRLQYEENEEGYCMEVTSMGI
jgi:hypothetical protein